MTYEIEKKFLVSNDVIPEIKEKTKITQAYLQVNSIEERIRSKDNIYYHTIKQDKKDANGLVRSENEAIISKQKFQDLLKRHIGNIIEKTRTTIPLENDLAAELDIYDGELEGLVIVEVEFPNEQSASDFHPPQWFGKEVTADKRYKNQSLALNGLPK
ncbi:MAG: CYTH domain-containing protein [Firmicutes bacterium]|nr:CYTH domain-containing protein [Bacillota bacterium]